MKLEGKILGREFKPIWKQVKRCFKKDNEEIRLEQHRKKEMQIEVYNKQDKKCNIWLEQNLTSRKTSAIVSTIEQMFETKAWKEVREGLLKIVCRLCKEQRETVQQLSVGCKMLASS